MRSRLVRFGLLLLFWLSLGACLSAQSETLTDEGSRKPNVVYIMADELGYFELSCMGHPLIQTPRIDRMAAEGVRFTQGLAGSPLCAPTRACLMTGKHSGHTSVRTNGGGTPLRADEETVASVLKRVGYGTGGFGKWGCGGRGSTGVPEKHGFDVFLGYYDQVHAHSYYPPYILRNSEEVPLTGNRGLSDGEIYSHYRIFDGAMQFIRDHREQPFFCYLPVTPPHGIFDIPDDDPAWKLYADKPWPEQARRYAAMVTMLDRQVGEVLDLLKELNLEKNTLVMFCGDNGGNDYFKDKDHGRGFHAPNVNPRTGVAFRGHKGQLYEGGLRIPMIARWPGRIEGGRVSDHLWYFPDVLPTLAELAGAEVPSDVDGLSIVPELLGEKTAGRAQEAHASLYWELGQQVAVRRGSWKAIQPGRQKPWELYDLSTDLSESKDVAAANPELLSEMKAFAKEAHTEAVPGTYTDETLHIRDRNAKQGNKKAPARGKRPTIAAKTFPLNGLVPREKVTIVRFSSEEAARGKLAKHAFDGDPSTHWHTRYQPEVMKPPHELILDLGATYDVTGLRYLARQDAGWNGAFGRCDLTVANAADGFGEPTMKGTLTKTKECQEVRGEAMRGRFVRLRVLSEVGGGPFASAAEIGIFGTPIEGGK